ncbi:MAG: biotin--[acetyl-CoA-carboxylase] ligase [Deltaproteobacteria bacterium]|nr:biotin--[acetyl-CoA-carboxylase] ligase [Deltaproteobacteria bacterium]
MIIPPLTRASWLGKHRIDLESCGSTNDEAARLARAGASHGTIVISELQTAGRGRHGRVWRSPPGGLYLSAVLRPPLPLAMVPPMTLAIGIGVCDAVRACGVGGVLKWPNDVLVDRLPAPGHRKLAGVLVEAQSQGGKLDAVVVGIGLNVRSERDDVATSLDAEFSTLPDQRPFEREVVIERLLGHVERWVDRYIAIGLAAVIPAWHERMAHGLMARATVDGEHVIGEVMGLDPEGALILRDGTGRVRRVRSGDVEVVDPRATAMGAFGGELVAAAPTLAC